MIIHDFELDWPISTNDIWKPSGKGRAIMRSPAYATWLNVAGWQIQAAKASGVLRGMIPKNFAARLVLSDTRFGKCDADNHVKGVLDVCAHHGLISNDKWCVRLLVEWGPVAGVRVILTEHPERDRSA